MNCIAMVSLGCPKNLVDSEYICEQLGRAGYTIVSDPHDADCVVVNTCSFLTSAVEESIETMIGLIRDGKDVICAGCMVSRFREELLTELPEVMLFAAPGAYGDLVGAIESGTRYLAPRFDGVVRRSCPTTGAFAYVKVSEGCSNHCSYCLIPSIRGELCSKPAAEVIAECRDLAGHGVREIILVAQDLGSYGSDSDEGPGLARLIEGISLIDPIKWIRLMYMHPATFTEAIVDAMAAIPKVVPYIDLPIQHISPVVLRAMGRKGGAEAVWRAIELLRSRIGDIWIRSTVMVGHPGEDDKAFAELEAFVSKGFIDHLGVFAYSPEAGTKSSALKGRIPRKARDARRDRIMAVQQEVSARRLQGLVGKTIPVLVEGRHPETDLLLVGRAPFQAPEVDGTVIINDGSAVFGTFSDVEITDSMEYDLVGRII